MTDSAIQHKLAAMFAANKDDVSVPKIYIDMTDDYPAACVLDELLFWTLPKKNGKTSLRVFRNGSLWLAVRRADWWDRKRITERQADRAIDKLIALDLVEKDVFLFDGKPTVHLRMKMQTFVTMYGDAISAIAIDENDENLTKDLADLYQMMGFPIHQTVISNSPNGEMLNSPNGEIINSPIQPLNTSTILSDQDLQEVNLKVNYILNQTKDTWQGRELLRDNLLVLADWYNKTTGQVMTKRVQKAWYKALQDWSDEGLSPANLQIAFDAQSKWRTVSDPNQLTKDACAIKAAGNITNTATVKTDSDGIPETY